MFKTLLSAQSEERRGVVGLVDEVARESVLMVARIWTLIPRNEGRTRRDIVRVFPLGVFTALVHGHTRKVRRSNGGVNGHCQH